MGKCESTIKKVLFVFEPELTQVYIAVDAVGDCPIGVQGWHHKTYPASKNILEIMQEEEFRRYLLWSLEAPT